MRQKFGALLATLILALSDFSAAANAIEEEQRADNIFVTPGAEASFHLEEDGSLILISGGAAQLSAFEARAARHYVGAQPPSAPVPNADVISAEDAGYPAPNEIARDQLTVRLVQALDAPDMILIIENGYDKALRYHAVLHAGSRSARTDVCIIPPGRYGFEHWPFAFEAVELYSFELSDWRDGDPIPCTE